MKKYVLTYILVKILFVGSVFSQILPFKYYGTKDGLPQSSVQAIIQDSKGFMWFGTRKGICRYNGVEFTNYSVKQGLLYHIVFSMTEDKNGDLIIATPIGLSVFDGEKFKNYETIGGEKNPHVFDIKTNAEGVAVFNSMKKLYKYEEGKIVPLYHEFLDKTGPIKNFDYDSKGNLWCTSKKGIFLIKDNQIKIFDNLSDDYIKYLNVIYADHKDEIWFTSSNSLFKIEKNGKIVNISRGENIGSEVILTMTMDNDGDLWLGTRSGLIKYNGRRLITYNIDNGLPDNSIVNIYMDREKNLWIGTLGGGVCKLKGKQFINFNENCGLCDFVMDVYEDRKGNFWFGGYAYGLFKYDGNQFTKYTVEDGLSSNIVLSVIEGNKGEILAGTDKGLSIFYGKDFTNVLKVDTVLISGIWDMEMDNNGAIWISGYHGLFKYDFGELSFIGGENSGLAKSVQDILIDRQNRVWLSTMHDGVFLINGEEIKKFNRDNILPDNYVPTLYEDKEGNIWMGTLSGAVKFNGQDYELYNTEDGLSDDTIYFIIGDTKGFMYFGTNRGVDKFDGENFRNYDFNDGLVGNEMNGRSCFMDSKGRLWFGSVDGVSLFYPDRDYSSPVAPKIYIENVKTLGKTYRDTSYIELPHNKKYIEFEYVGLGFKNEDEILYQYKLEGFDKSWSEITNRRYAAYTNLEPGIYTFFAKALNKDGYWSEIPASVSIKILPPFWQNEWFIVLVIISIISLGAIAYKIRVNTLTQKAIIKQQSLATEQILKSEERARRYLEQMKAFSEVSADLLKETDINKICQKVADIIVEMGGFERVLFLFMEKDYKFEVMAYNGFSKKEIDEIEKLGAFNFKDIKSYFNKDFRITPNSLCYHISSRNRIYKLAYPERKKKYLCRNWNYGDILMIPIYDRNRKISGFIAMDEPVFEDSISPEALLPIELFANEVSIAVENKRLFNYLAESEKKYKNIFESSFPIFIFDRNLNIVASNKAFNSFIKKDKDSFKGFEIIKDLFSFDEVELIKDNIMYVLDEKHTLLEKEFKTIDNRWIKMSFLPVSEQKQKQVMVVAQEITERKMLEEQLVQSEKLASIGKLVAGIAHEINNPLTAVLGYAEIIKNRFKKDVKTYDMAEKITKSTQRCAKIISGLLGFARKTELKKKNVYIIDALEEPLKLKESEFKLNNIKLNKKFENSLPPVYGDIHQLQQVFLNIINNAFDSMVKKGGYNELTVKTYKENDKIIISFTDTGLGIKEEEISKIFDPFWTTKEVGKGTGLGMSISYGIVKNHGGDIYIDNNYKNGARCVVKLPTSSVKDEITVKMLKYEYSNAKIMVIDDEFEIADLQKNILEDRGYRVDIAFDNEKIIELLNNSDYDLILADLHFSENVGGLKILEYIKNNYPGTENRIAFITGDISKYADDLLRQIKRPYLYKPFKIENYMDFIQESLEYAKQQD